jgi:hypothetical protein
VGERFKVWGCSTVSANPIAMHSGSREKREILEIKSEFKDQNFQKGTHIAALEGEKYISNSSLNWFLLTNDCNQELH